ncbi:MAG: ABC transporter permease [Lachnospiraceae bacterium]|nr:ABC transporter permease [Lachnospiraceae bacterium]
MRLFDTFTEADFEKATVEERASMTQKRAAVSYWKDAARRFKANHVSMVALFVVFLIIVFTFFGPLFIPYNYADQYRNSMKLAPMEYAENEQHIMKVLEEADAVYASSLQPGSMTSVKKGDYCFKVSGKWYGFTAPKRLRDAVLVFSKNNPGVLLALDEDDIEAHGLTKGTEIELQSLSGAAQGTRLNFITRLTPHYFGTDSSGRDLMARCMYGGRVSLIIGVTASLIVLVIGSVYGSISGLLGGRVDFIMMRIVDIIYSVPDVLIVLLLQVVLQTPLQNWFDTSKSAFVKALGSLGVGIVSIFITFALLYWVGMSRIIRGQVLQLKKQEYVTAAYALGVPTKRIIRRHLLPNCVGQLVVATCLQIPSAIFLESFLSFLGLGVSAPMASLGSLCSDALDTIRIYPYRLLFPAILLTILVLSLNLVGDGLRDALDPRLKK